MAQVAAMGLGKQSKFAITAAFVSSSSFNAVTWSLGGRMRSSLRIGTGDSGKYEKRF
jgi:hypothetical protein